MKSGVVGRRGGGGESGGRGGGGRKSDASHLHPNPREAVGRRNHMKATRHGLATKYVLIECFN